MEIEQVAELARTVAALPQGHQDFFNGLVADERAKAAAAKRIAEMRSMSDEEAVLAAVNAGVTLKHRAHRPGNVVMDVDPQEVARVLREAGFVRWPANFKTKPHEFFEAVRSGMIHRDTLVDLGVSKDMSWQGEGA